MARPTPSLGSGLSVSRHMAFSCVALVAVALGGCANGQYGSELSVRPRPRSLNKVERTTLQLPADQAFNITLSEQSARPGLTGTADAQATVDKQGTASAVADVRDGGAAEAGFQLGHAFTNETDRQVDVEFRVHFDYEFAAQIAPDVGTGDGAVVLRLYARSARRRLLRDVCLVNYTTENGATKRKSSEQAEFTLTLAPHESIDVYLAGQARIEAPDTHSADGSLKLNGVRFEVVTQPAPAVQAAPHEPR